MLKKYLQVLKKSSKKKDPHTIEPEPNAGLEPVVSIPPSLVDEEPSTIARPTNSATTSPAPNNGPAQGFFAHSHHLNIYNPLMQSISNQPLDSFLKDLAKHIMTGAAYDSSARDPPPRCHPGTRISTVKQAREFFDISGHKKRLLWIVGPAGVGKSAIMQTIAETSPDLGASIFFTVNVRDDPSKFVVTLAYQMAVRHSIYQENLKLQLARDPTLLDKAISAQFEAFIVLPFTVSRVNGDSAHLLILIDGLDECAGSEAQRNILGLITGLITRYPSVPLLWIIASRPEPHITSFFDRSVSSDVYVKLELSNDSDESQRDVEHFLRNQLLAVRDRYRYQFALLQLPRWPQESKLIQLIGAADGLFAYAEAVSRFIEDPNIADPASQLDVMLQVIESTTRSHIEGQVNPMAQLHALYDQVLSRIPQHIFPITRDILIGNGVTGFSNYWTTLDSSCRWLGLTPSKAYSALHHLYSVLKIPSPEIACNERLTTYHKSFNDFLASRYPDVEEDWKSLEFSSSIRILKDIPATRAVDPSYHYIKLSWCSPNKSEQEHQAHLYPIASRALVESGLFRESLLARDAGTLHALQVMFIGTDPGAWSFESQCITYSWFLDDAQLSVVLVDSNLLQEMKVIDFDTSHVNDDFLLHLICRYKRDGVSQDWAFLRQCPEKGRDDHKWDSEPNRFAAIVPCKCKCIKSIWERLEQTQEHAPETQMRAYIPAHGRGLVIWKFIEEDDREWTYIIPYIFPEGV